MGPDLAPSLSSQFMGQRRRRPRTHQASFFHSIGLSLLFSWQQMKCRLKNWALPPSIIIITSVFNAVRKYLLTNQSSDPVTHFVHLFDKDFKITLGGFWETNFVVFKKNFYVSVFDCKILSWLSTRYLLSFWELMFSFQILWDCLIFISFLTIFMM